MLPSSCLEHLGFLFPLLPFVLLMQSDANALACSGAACVLRSKSLKFVNHTPLKRSDAWKKFIHVEPGESRAGMWLGDELGDLDLLVHSLAGFLSGSTSLGATPSRSWVVGFGHETHIGMQCWLLVGSGLLFPLVFLKSCPQGYWGAGGKRGSGFEKPLGS